MKSIAFLGQKGYFHASSFTGQNSQISGKFFDVGRDGTQSDEEVSKILKKLIDYQPDYLVYFRPDLYPSFTRKVSEVYAGPRIGFLTEPVTHKKFSSPDNIRERKRHLLSTLKSCEVDFWYCYTNELADFVSAKVTVQSVRPLPVNDKLFVGASNRLDFSQPTFVHLGRLNEYRMSYLNSIKENCNPIIIENGVPISDLEKFVKSSIVGINLHVGPINNFENRVLLHMARNHLVMSQVLRPDFGLLPGCEYIYFETQDELAVAVNDCQENPELAKWVASRGHMFAQKFRASKQWLDILDLDNVQ